MKIAVAGVGRIGRLHAGTMAALPPVDEVVVADALPDIARQVAEEQGFTVADDMDALLASKPDGLIITTATNAHAELIHRGIEAGIPTFCEKPVALDLATTIGVVEAQATSGVPVQMGFNRRFDAGFMRLRQAVASGELGWLSSVSSTTLDHMPPPAHYVPTSGGIFRDCTIHDFDVIRFVLGTEAKEVYATGSTKGDPVFADNDDVSTGTAIITMDDDTLVLVTGARYNGAGHDVRMEVHGADKSMVAGLTDYLPLDPADPGVEPPKGPRVSTFTERFGPAYVAELTRFADVVAGTATSPCSVDDGLQALRIAEACVLSRKERRPVALTEIADASR